jgi:hypothetical protein
MQFECNAFHEIAKVVCTANDIGIDRRGCTAYCDGPPVSVVWEAQKLLFLGSEDGRSVPIYNWAMYGDSLTGFYEQKRVVWLGNEGDLP